MKPWMDNGFKILNIIQLQFSYFQSSLLSITRQDNNRTWVSWKGVKTLVHSWRRHKNWHRQKKLSYLLVQENMSKLLYSFCNALKNLFLDQSNSSTSWHNCSKHFFARTEANSTASLKNEIKCSVCAFFKLCLGNYKKWSMMILVWSKGPWSANRGTLKGY